MKSFWKVLVWVIVVVLVTGILIVGGFLLFSVLTEFKPASVEQMNVSGNECIPVDTAQEFSLITWNIGYGGLGEKMDFFYDGGSRVRPDREYFQHSLDGIFDFLKDHDTIDFMLLQEVDKDSKRSYHVDEVARLRSELPGYCSIFGLNYDCWFVPVPISQPMGLVRSGMTVLSRFRIDAATRHGFDKHTSWPGRLFNLKRCFLVSRFSLSNGHQLVVMNIHNSAFDTGGILRQREMEMVRDFMIREFEKGNYLVAGGDWNANPPGFRSTSIQTGDRVKKVEFTDLSDYFPEWIFAFDPTSPTNRDVNTPYNPGLTPTTIIDFFLVSPNVKIETTRTYQTGFEYADHQPLFLKIRLR